MLEDSERQSEATADIYKTLKSEVFGQDRALEAVMEAVTVAGLGLSDPELPLGSFLFLGPTGVGKSQIGRTLARAIHGPGQGLEVINCTEFSNPHEVAKLIGAPPGYVGNDVPPFLTPEKLEKRFTIILFEELEKGDRALHHLLLQVLEKGELKTGRGQNLNFRGCFIFMTSNCGSKEADHQLRQKMGFAPSPFTPEEVDNLAGEVREKDEAIYMHELEKSFSPEFINRFDWVTVLHRLTRADLLKVLNKFIIERAAILERSHEIKLIVSEKAREFLLLMGCNLLYGARPLRRAVQKHLMFPIAKAIGKGYFHSEDTILADISPGSTSLMFKKKNTELKAMANGV